MSLRFGRVSPRFVGKTVVVTGAGSGIGRETARLFACEGAWVLAANLDESAAETAATAPTSWR